MPPLSLFYTLDRSGQPIPEKDAHRWAEWFGANKHRRIVRQDDISRDVRVSTVFLAIDFNHTGRGPPILWETMILGGPHNEYTRRYTSRADALKRPPRGGQNRAAAAVETQTLDKMSHFVDSSKGPCPVCKGFRAFAQGELSTKWEMDQNRPNRPPAATGSTSPALKSKG